jgi:hypothetical protein
MYRVIKFTGALGANNTVTIAPNTAPAYFIIENATTDSGSGGPYSVILSQGSGANVTVQNGKNAIVYCDGAGSGAAVVDALADLQVGTLEVTGAAAIDGAATLGSTLAVTGAVTGSSTIQGTTITATTAFVPDASDGAALGTTSLEFSDLYLADEAVIGFGDDQDVTLTHVADTGLLLNSTMQLQFNDATQYINAPSGTVLDINATDEIELNATLVDVNANLDVSGTLTQAGASQFNSTITVGADDQGYDVKFFGDTASAYLLWDTSTDDLILGGAAKLGVGETVPLGTVHVKTGDAGATSISANGDELVIEGSAAVGMTLIGAADNLVSIFMGDAADADVAGIGYDNSGNSMRFTTNASEAMRIDSSSNVIIGGSTAATGGVLTVEGSDTAAGSLNYMAAIRNSDAYSTTPAAGILFQGKYNSAGTYADAGGIEVVKESAVDGEYGFGLGLHTRANGASITEKLHITGAGLLGLGTAAPTEEIHVFATAPTIRLEDSQNNLSGYINGDNGNILLQTYNANRDIIFGENDASGELMRVKGTGLVHPGADNTQDFGSSSYRWAEMFAGTGTINTSDEREKTEIADLDEAERRVATALKGLVKKFKYRDAIGIKGDDARIHVGVIAQEVVAAFGAEGLDATRYALLCYDEWDAVEEELNDDGEVATPALEAGDRYGIRYDELLAFMIAAL